MIRIIIIIKLGSYILTGFYSMNSTDLIFLKASK